MPSYRYRVLRNGKLVALSTTLREAQTEAKRVGGVVEAVMGVASAPASTPAQGPMQNPAAKPTGAKPKKFKLAAKPKKPKKVVTLDKFWFPAGKQLSLGKLEIVLEDVLAQSALEIKPDFTLDDLGENVWSSLVADGLLQPVNKELAIVDEPITGLELQTLVKKSNLTESKLVLEIGDPTPDGGTVLFAANTELDFGTFGDTLDELLEQRSVGLKPEATFNELCSWVWQALKDEGYVKSPPVQTTVIVRGDPISDELLLKLTDQSGLAVFKGDSPKDEGPFFKGFNWDEKAYLPRSHVNSFTLSNNIREILERSDGKLQPIDYGAARDSVAVALYQWLKDNGYVKREPDLNIGLATQAITFRLLLEFALREKYIEVSTPAGEEHIAYPDTPAFWAWFKHSAVVDKNGKPLAVYHGSRDNEFTSFDKKKIDAHHNGFFFTDSLAMAASYTGGYAAEYTSDPTPPLGVGKKQEEGYATYAEFVADAHRMLPAKDAGPLSPLQVATSEITNKFIDKFGYSIRPFFYLNGEAKPTMLPDISNADKMRELIFGQSGYTEMYIARDLLRAPLAAERLSTETLVALCQLSGWLLTAGLLTEDRAKAVRAKSFTQLWSMLSREEHYAMWGNVTQNFPEFPPRTMFEDFGENPVLFDGKPMPYPVNSFGVSYGLVLALSGDTLYKFLEKLCNTLEISVNPVFYAELDEIELRLPVPEPYLDAVPKRIQQALLEVANTAMQLTLKGSDTYRKTKPGVKRVFLSFQNPLVVDGKGAEWNSILFRNKYTNTDKIAYAAAQEGYDSVIIKSIKDYGGASKTYKPGNVYIAFSPTQVKHAVLNDGRFSETSADIRNPARKNPAPDRETVRRQVMDFNNRLYDYFSDELGQSIKIDMGFEGFDSAGSPLVAIDKLIVPGTVREKGLGTQAMQKICDEADKHGWVLVLTPSRQYGGSVRRLTQFYGRFGFVRNSGKNKDFATRQTMLRPARKPSRVENPEDMAKQKGLLHRMLTDKADTFAKKVSWVKKHMPDIDDPQSFVGWVVKAENKR